MSHPLVIANWKMNIPSGGISGWIPEEMVSTNDELDFNKKSSADKSKSFLNSGNFGFVDSGK